MKIVATIEARMGSSRLPGKVMKPILGRPVLELLIERLKRIDLLDEIIIATTVKEKDKVIERLARNIGVKCFRGSEEDVLGRVLKAAKSVNADLIVEVTGDCPLMDPDIVKKGIKLYLEGNYDYVANNLANNCLKKTFPDGLGIQVFSVKLLEEVDSLCNDPVDREHVSLYIYNHPEKYKLRNFRATGDLYWPELEITLDTIEDYKLIKIIFENLYPRKPDFNAYDIVRFLKKNPQLLKINKKAIRKVI